MLKEKHRLTTFLFRNVFEKGESRGNKSFEIVYRKNNLSYPRFGIVVSNKLTKSAVERNAVKRKVRAILNNFIILSKSSCAFVKNSWDIVILTRKSVLGKSYQEIEEAINELLVGLS